MPMTKGNRIKNRREELGIGQTELANKIGISKQSLYKYEKDIVINIPLDIIENLSKALNVSPSFLMGWKENTSKNKVFLDIFVKLSPESQDKVIDYMNYQIEKENNNAKS